MMRNHLCWEPQQVRRVINPFAEHIPDSLFQAVHSDWALQVAPPIGKSYQDISADAYEEMSPLAFLKDFMREDRPHALAAILGATGSGKSHLVHWMRLNMVRDEKLIILVVKKSGTSLRAIVKMIIDQLPTREQQGFLDTLNRAGEGTATREGQKQQLLNDLAFAIREEQPPANASELEAELAKRLPDLFQDPYMRQEHFLRDGTIIAEIVDHIFAASNAKDRPNRRREFVEQDLPLGGFDFVHASTNARNAMQVIELEPGVSQPLTVQIINRNLDKAVARTLSFSGDRVEELMGRLRAHLKRQDKELVLLVEEFARLQGIDRPLLQAITTQGDDEQCKMRTAIAVTTGFFESVAETAYMRTTHIVDMDRSAGREEGTQVSKASLSTFASRYLNAVRLGLEKIEHWSESAEPGEHAPSRCKSCAHVSGCHQVFGAVDGYGLYPFTETALWNATSRADLAMPERLNPRVLQNNVLVEVLDTYAGSIQAGQYPPYRLLEKLETPRAPNAPRALDLTARNRLRGLNPQAEERWVAALELYDGSGKIENLPPRLREAFSIPEIPGAGTVDISDAGPTPQQPHPQRARVASREDAAIEEWIKGGGLDQTVATTLRNLIFSSVCDTIDWDMLGLERSSFVGKTGRAFQPNSVSFERQTTQVQSHLQIQLRIPGPHADAVKTGAALQGLTRASKAGFNWDFEGGDGMLAAFLDCLAIWAKEVERQLIALCAPSANWSQSVAALQLLFVGAAIGNKIKPEARLAEMIDGAFGTWPAECQASTPELKSIYDKLLKNRDKLASIVRAQISSMKGGRVGAMLNPGRFIAAVRTFRQAKWRLTLTPTNDDKLTEFRSLSKLYKEVQAALEPAITSEWNVRRQWLSTMEEAFGESPRASITETLSSALNAVDEAGVAVGGTLRPLTQALEIFKMVQFDDAVAAARVISRLDDPLAALPHFGRGRRSAVEAGTELTQLATKFVDAVDQNLSAFGKDHGATHAATAASIERIDGALEQIQAELKTIMHGNGEAAHAA